MRLVLASIGAALAVATDVFYLWITFHQGEPIDALRVIIVASLILVAAVVAFAGAASIDPPVSRALLIVGASLLLAFGVLAVFSIGVLLLCAGVLTLIAAAAPPRRK